MKVAGCATVAPGDTSSFECIRPEILPMKLKTPMLAVVIGGLVFATTACAQVSEKLESAYKPSVGQEGKDVIWVPTPQALVDRMLELADLRPEDYLVDLGSGDGRTVITAARRGARAHGIEFNRDMGALSKRAARTEGLDGQATFEQGDIFQSDFSKATVVTLFLLPQLNLRLRPTLLDMKPGTRVVSNSFNMGDWEPDDEVRATDNCEQYCSAYKWIVPAKVEGTWQMDGRELVLKQKYQTFSGTLREGNKTVRIKDGRLKGTQIAFTAGNDRFAGEVNGTTMQGKLNDGAAWSASRLK